MWEDCKVFKPETDGFEIRRIAAGVSVEDAARYFGYELKELPEVDQRFLKAMHTRGRVAGCVEAADHLFTQMRTARNGGALAVQYLQTFSDDWPSEGAGVPGSGLNFKVVLE